MKFCILRLVTVKFKNIVFAKAFFSMQNARFIFLQENLIQKGLNPVICYTSITPFFTVFFQLETFFL